MALMADSRITTGQETLRGNVRGDGLGVVLERYYGIESPGRLGERGHGIRWSGFHDR